MANASNVMDARSAYSKNEIAGGVAETQAESDFKSFGWFCVPTGGKKPAHDGTIDIFEEGNPANIHFRIEIKHQQSLKLSPDGRFVIQRLKAEWVKMGKRV